MTDWNRLIHIEARKRLAWGKIDRVITLNESDGELVELLTSAKELLCMHNSMMSDLEHFINEAVTVAMEDLQND